MFNGAKLGPSRRQTNLSVFLQTISTKSSKFQTNSRKCKAGRKINFEMLKILDLVKFPQCFLAQSAIDQFFLRPKANLA